MYYTVFYESPIGRMLLAGDEKSLVGAWFEEQKYFAGTLPTEGVLLQADNREHSVLEMTVEWLERYFAGERPAIAALPLAPKGSEFRKLVWQALCEIPYGETVTYGQLAKKTALLMGRERMSAQAVGGAVGHNPIGIIIPCHRVVGAGGSLTGYAGGLDRKSKLLEFERETV